MPLPVSPAIAIIAIVGAATALIWYFAYKEVDYLRPRVSAEEFLPLSPLEGPPIPRFFKDKPEVAEGMLRELKG